MPAVLGVVAALARESALVARAAHAAGVASRVRIACRGMGPERAAEAARELVDAGVARLLITGYAGALHVALAPGDLVLASGVHGAARAALACEAALLARAEQALAGVATLHVGALASVASVLHEPRQRAALEARCGALAVDMETAPAAGIAARHDVPWAALRAVSDGAAQCLPRGLERVLDPLGRPTPGGVLRALAVRPWELRHLPALARGVRCADRSLEPALVRLLPVLADAGK